MYQDEMCSKTMKERRLTNLAARFKGMQYCQFCKWSHRQIKTSTLIAHEV